MFADYTTPVLSHSNFSSLMKDANVGLTAYITWFRLNTLFLNIKKSNFIFLCGKKSYSKDLSKITMESYKMPQVSSTRFLGIIVDEILSWKQQTDLVSRKINKSIGIIKRVRHLVITNCLLTLYYSLIYPYVSYCSIV